MEENEVVVISNYELVRIDGSAEPLIHDRALAEKLGFSRKTEIRKIINKNKRVLERRFGKLVFKQRTSNGTARSVKTYYLNAKQALFIISKCDTELADEITSDIIDVYYKWKMQDATSKTAELMATNGVGGELIPYTDNVTFEDLMQYGQNLIVRVEDNIKSSLASPESELHNALVTNITRQVSQGIAQSLPQYVERKVKEQLQSATAEIIQPLKSQNTMLRRRIKQAEEKSRTLEEQVMELLTLKKEFIKVKDQVRQLAGNGEDNNDD